MGWRVHFVWRFRCGSFRFFAVFIDPVGYVRIAGPDRTERCERAERAGVSERTDPWKKTGYNENKGGRGKKIGYFLCKSIEFIAFSAGGGYTNGGGLSNLGGFVGFHSKLL